MEKYCLNCQSQVHGRADKKFCDDQCRSAYNFEHQDKEKDLIRQVNAILRKNRQILHTLNPSGKTTLPKSELAERGFNFEYYTNCYETAEQKRYYYCYDMGYLPLSEKIILLVIKDNYPKSYAKK